MHPKPPSLFHFITLFFAFIVLTQCASPREEGSVQIGATTQALHTNEATRVTVTVLGTQGPSITQDLTKSKGQWSGTITPLPIGQHDLKADAFDAQHNLLYTSTLRAVSVTKGSPTIILFHLQKTTPHNPLQNTNPTIHSFVASSNVLNPQDPLQFAIHASDADPKDALSYHWTALDASGRSAGTFFGGNIAPSIRWQAPLGATNNYTIVAKVTDPSGRQAATAMLIAGPKIQNEKAYVTVEFNTWPEIASISVLPHGRISPNGSAYLDLNANDPDGDTLVYAWSNDCGGSFSNPSIEDPVWTAPSTPPASGLCNLSVLASDGNGGTNNGVLTVQVGAPIQADIAPQIVSTFQSEKRTEAGQSIVFRVQATDPQGTPLTFAWFASPGTLTPPNHTAQTSEVTWTAPAHECDPTITAIITNAKQHQTTYAFKATVTNCGDTSQISVGDYHSCAIKTNGNLFCWGSNDYGQLADGSTNNTSAPPATPTLTDTTQVSAGREHTCAITTDKQLYCWGRNHRGQLGDGTNTDKKTHNNPIMNNAKQVSTSYRHSCAIKGNGRLFCWGLNNHGQLGNGTNTDTNTPANPIFDDISQVSAGGLHTCALKTNGQLFCWGQNSHGQLGDGTNTDTNAPSAAAVLHNVWQVAAGQLHTCALKTNGQLYCWGQNNYGQLGDGTNTNAHLPRGPILLDVSRISADGSHTCAIKTNGQLFCWGLNDHGQLGDSTNANRNTPTLLPFQGTSSISLGYEHTCALKGSGELFCWGRNNRGQLGDGTNISTNMPPSVPINFP